jgi:hypothetical protein
MPEGFISVVLLVYLATLVAGLHSAIGASNGTPAPKTTISAPAPPPIADDILLPTSGS